MIFCVASAWCWVLNKDDDDDDSKLQRISRKHVTDDRVHRVCRPSKSAFVIKLLFPMSFDVPY